MRAPNLRYAALHVTYWMLFAAALVFPAPFLLDRGLSNTHVGATIALAGLASVVLQPLVASWAEGSRMPLRYWTAGLVVAGAVAGAALLLPLPPIGAALVYGAVLALVQSVVPLLNALGMAATHVGVPVRFGPARGLGSASFATLALGGGALVAASGSGLVPWLVLATSALLLVALLTFVLPREEPVVVDDGDPSTHPLAEPLTLSPAQRRRFWVLLGGLTLGYAAHSIASFHFQAVTRLGGDSSHLGVAFALGAASEVVPMLLFGRLLSRWRPVTLMRFAAVLFAVRAAAALLAPTLELYLASAALQGLSFALMIPASVHYVDEVFPRGERVRGQAWAALTSTLGSVLISLVGGFLIDAAGVPAMLAAATLAGALGIVAVRWGTLSD